MVDTFTLHKEQQPCDGGDQCPSKVFTDVDQKDYYHEAVDQLYLDGIMVGCGNGHYGVGEPMTRGMIVSVLYRMAGSPQVTGTSKFTDLKKDAYYEKAVIWAEENGIAYGVSKTEFAPEQATTRQQMAAFLYRYAKLRGMDVSGQNDLSAFRDSGTVDAYAKTAVAWAVDSGIIFGTETDTLSPNMTLPREQCAAMLYRLMKTA